MSVHFKHVCMPVTPMCKLLYNLSTWGLLRTSEKFMEIQRHCGRCRHRSWLAKLGGRRLKAPKARSRRLLWPGTGGLMQRWKAEILWPNWAKNQVVSRSRSVDNKRREVRPAKFVATGRVQPCICNAFHLWQWIGMKHCQAKPKICGTRAFSSSRLDDLDSMLQLWLQIFTT